MIDPHRGDEANATGFDPPESRPLARHASIPNTLAADKRLPTDANDQT